MKIKSKIRRNARLKKQLKSANAGCLLVFMLTVGLPFIAFGLIFVWVGHVNLHAQARLQKTAVDVPAEIVSSKILSSTSAGRGSKTSYWAEVVFSYQRQGKRWTSNRVWVVGVGGTKSEMEAVTNSYPQGSQVSAFVDPNDPAFAFLEKRWSSMPYVSVVTGLLPVCFVTSLGVLMIGWRRPDITFVVAVAVGVAVATVAIYSGAHYYRFVPSVDQMWWGWMACRSNHCCSDSGHFYVESEEAKSFVFGKLTYDASVDDIPANVKEQFSATSNFSVLGARDRRGPSSSIEIFDEKAWAGSTEPARRHKSPSSVLGSVVGVGRCI